MLRSNIEAFWRILTPTFQMWFLRHWKTHLCDNFLYSVIRQVISITCRIAEVPSCVFLYVLDPQSYSAEVLKCFFNTQISMKSSHTFEVGETLVFILISKMAANVNIKYINHVSVKQVLPRAFDCWQENFWAAAWYKANKNVLESHVVDHLFKWKQGVTFNISLLSCAQWICS